MNERDRRLLASGINPLTGQALTAPVLTAPGQDPRIAAPAQAVAASPWVGPTATPVTAAPVQLQTWRYLGETEMKLDVPHVVLHTRGKAGDAQRWVIRRSLILAVQNGQIVGADGSPVRFS